MKPIILVSKQDKAGQNIEKQLEKLNCKFPLIETEKLIIYPENIDKELKKKFDFDVLIFASKHQSEIPHKTFSVHVPGNWNKAELGGEEGKVCMCSALFVKFLFQNLYKNSKDNENVSEYSCTMEVTHHGPYIETPCCFIEIGSSEKEWQDINAAEIIAKTILQSIENFEVYKNDGAQKIKIAIGIGGKHYCPNFNKIQLSSEYAISHIIPEYSLPLTEEMLKQAISKTKEKVDCVILDWKSMGKSEERQKTIDLLNKLNLKFVRTSDINKEEKEKF